MKDLSQILDPKFMIEHGRVKEHEKKHTIGKRILKNGSN